MKGQEILFACKLVNVQRHNCFALRFEIALKVCSDGGDGGTLLEERGRG